MEIKGGQGVRWFSWAWNWFIENEISADAFFADNQKKYLILTLTDITKQRQYMEALAKNADGRR